MDLDRDPVSFHKLGQKYLGLGKTVEAERSFRRAVMLAPKFAEAHYDLGRVLQAGGDVDGAAACFRAAVAAAPAYAEAWFALGLFLAASGQVADGEEAFGKAAAAAPGFAQAHFERARLREARGDDAGALQGYEDAWRAAPAYVEARSAAMEIIRRTRQAGHPFLTEWLDRIDARLGDLRRDDTRPLLVCCFNRIERMGPLSVDVALLRQLIRDRFARVVMLTRPRRFAANTALFDLVMDGLTVIEIEDGLLDELTALNAGTWERDGVTYLLSGPYGLPDYVTGEGVLEGLALPEAWRARARELARTMGVADDDRVVVCHMRERGFIETFCHPGELGRLVEESNAHRNVDPANYLEAIRFLIDSGHVVVRIGDRSMTRLPDLGPRLIDLPFRDGYDPLLDLAFVERCAFMLNTGSGVSGLSCLFGRPALSLDLIYNATSGGVLSRFRLPVPSLFAFKTVRRNGADEPVSLAEILTLKLDTLSRATEFAGLGLVCEGMRPADIAAACREMLDLLAEPALPPSPETDRFLEMWRADPERAARGTALAFRLSQAACRAQPGYFGV